MAIGIIQPFVVLKELGPPIVHLHTPKISSMCLLDPYGAHSSGFRHANSHNPNPKDGRYPGDKSGRKSHGPSKSLPASVGPSQKNRVEWRATPLCSQMRGARGAPAPGAHFGAPPASAPSTAKSLVVPRWGAACYTTAGHEKEDSSSYRDQGAGSKANCIDRRGAPGLRQDAVAEAPRPAVPSEG
ncbi:hypothetical protein PCASD_15475 [Puccinia coronata f. sp. avenae]|uniref:Uncharacterized protein n=1 Tax=Puccinia coronata f. sp. avenae TaxID=200324 RepID=A0A2N5TZF0_9BASI|nr:hypothetical protein PCASD_19976 [Puccinia coronata f. sp. avenae]PLW30886.1 hypothetical protein PCASD_15475 [Puccinia coronata f. sp. avenae]